MKLVVLGATGRTGRLVTEQALARGHSVAAASEPRDSDQLTSLITGQDAVISCLGQRSSKDGGLLQESARAVIRAMTTCGVRRYLVISQGLLYPTANPLLLLLRLLLARQVADSTAMEREIRAAHLDWTIVRPPRLLEGGRPRGYRFNVGAMPPGKVIMERADLAAFLLDEAEAQNHVRAIVGLASAMGPAADDTPQRRASR
ncbi:NAD(P)-dependent oxidoreductase [Bradyrhizobium sp. CCGB01]|uniref:NAD(P)-dependent oxidoreductase n=1 Tax=Bradyrhizobium sp. CCGB01 TaxID=2949634 RepID=UPI0020B389EF|nr:NAD(P)H-binding protein [Bradyrhizobium sp. CCGB01]MCP3404751.1 NAD(P)H-binding protein [Bradyrhizobium sp. CCGB01]